MFNGSTNHTQIAAMSVVPKERRRIYNIVLNSAFGDGAPATSTKFYVDWSIMPEGEYKVKFTFTSATTATDLGDITNAIIYLDLGQGSTSIIETSPTSSTLTLAGTRGQFLGCLRQTSYTLAADYVTYLYADLHTNPPIYIFNRPRNSQVSVDIHTSSTTQQTNFSPIGAYVLTLSFELQL